MTAASLFCAFQPTRTWPRVRLRPRILTGYLSLFIAASVHPAISAAQFCGDPDRSGTITVADGVSVLRAAALLSSNCELDTCDVDATGTITVADGVNVLRAAASLPNACDTETSTPTPVVTLTPDLTPTPNPTPTGAKRVFATSTTHTGGFGGTSGADSICAARAAAAGLSGTFLAWISDASTSPSTRFVQSAVPYRLVDGTLIANDWSDLKDGMLANEINLDETGAAVNADVWTGTGTGGTPLVARCSDWVSSDSSVTGRCGTTGAVGAGWTDFLTPGCNLPLHLYCFEQ